METTSIDWLIGKTLKEIKVSKHKEFIIFTPVDGDESLMMHHTQDCCETVYLTDIDNDIQGLLGEPIVEATERTEDGTNNEDWIESCTFTFYLIATAKHAVVLRWEGRSNGYYSERVDCDIIKNKKQK